MIISMTDPAIWPVESVKAIADKFGFVVLNRSSINLQEVINGSSTLNNIKSSIDVVNEFPGNFDSSTKAREEIRQGKRANELLHESVCDYIQKNKLYV